MSHIIWIEEIEIIKLSSFFRPLHNVVQNMKHVLKVWITEIDKRVDNRLTVSSEHFNYVKETKYMIDMKQTRPVDGKIVFSDK